MEKANFEGKHQDDLAGEHRFEEYGKPTSDASPAAPAACTLSASQQHAVREHLKRLLDSPAFRSSSRSKEFLTYIVEQTLAGEDDALKERSIGSEVFHRSPDYLTGDDPVVRVTAREVRRRLARYHAEQSGSGEIVRIELPVGSYRPEFHWAPALEPEPEEASNSAVTEPSDNSSVVPSKPPRRPWWIATAATVLALAFGYVWFNRVHAAPPQPADLFWAPVIASSQPVLVCLNSPVVYQPSMALYQRHGNSRRYATESQRILNPLQLAPNAPLQWRDLKSVPNFYVANGDAYAAADFSALFATRKKNSELQIGDGCSSQDLRYSPAVLVGALNNEWTLRLTSKLPFRFAEENNQGRIEAAADPAQRWTQHWDQQGRLDRDYGVVSRLFDAETGQLVIIVAGIGPEGTRAVSDLITSPKALSRILQSAPPGWADKDLQMVLSTSVVDGVPGKSSLVTARFWPAH